ncbi:hypothetical protein Y032_0352g3264 [Ancylostoma ceylanicum]|uniref:Uncharacterized protein n=1 Tax=Ancylostoma ceylanicum TaxID=53326 RepID=A0A016RWQ8_9BILA|nr:hypothetical protein Y032_0352g3264 [Ancylostoma ceylanicum]
MISGGRSWLPERWTTDRLDFLGNASSTKDSQCTLEWLQRRTRTMSKKFSGGVFREMMTSPSASHALRTLSLPTYSSFHTGTYIAQHDREFTVKFRTVSLPPRFSPRRYQHILDLLATPDSNNVQLKSQK